jgi:hypothetical protein
MARRVHVERRAIEAPVASAREVASSFVESLGWRPPPAWTEVDREGAIEVVSSALMNDLVSDAPMLPFREAEERARELVAGVDDGAVFFTNGTLEDARRGFGRRGITGAKADAGVIAVSGDRVTMLWIEDS